MKRFDMYDRYREARDYVIMFERVAGTIMDERMGMSRITPAELLRAEHQGDEVFHAAP